MTKNNFIKVTWNDAYFYKHGNIRNSVSKMITFGFVYQKDNNCIIVINPITINTTTKFNYPPDIYPKYLYIPNGMIDSIEEIKKGEIKNELKRCVKIIEQNLTKEQLLVLNNKIK